MTVIRTDRNFVCAYDALPEDEFIDVYLTGEDTAGNSLRRRLLTQPIDQYPQALEWALGMADVMARPMEIVTITAEEHEDRLLREGALA